MTTLRELLIAYEPGLLGLLALAVILVVQFAVADIAGIRAGHVPGTPVAGGHGDFVFRATRAFANSNEGLGLFLLLVLLCFATGASARWANGLIWLYAAARAAYTACYYADWRTPRSLVFAVGTTAQLGLLVIVCVAI